MHLISGRLLREGGRTLIASDGKISEIKNQEALAAAPEGALVELSCALRLGALVVEDIVSLEVPVRALASSPYRGGAASDSEFTWFHHRAANLKARADLFRAIRAHFDQHFVEVMTPSMVPSPGLDLHLDAFRVEENGLYLITSPEYQMKRMLAGGMTRIYQLARCFRRGEVGRRHEPEFTMLEWYRAFSPVSDVMRDTEQVVHAASRAMTGSERLPSGTNLSGRWPSVTVYDAFMEHAGVDPWTLLSDAEDHERFFRVFVETVEPSFPKSPFFLTEWPAPMASLARLVTDERGRQVAERFEAYVDGVELCNGFGELVDPFEQRVRLERDQKARGERGLDVYPIDERFLRALEEGVPASAGNALGVDRLLMLILGEEDIGNTRGFPTRRI